MDTFIITIGTISHYMVVIGTPTWNTTPVHV
jgi:hypothetical protein